MGRLTLLAAVVLNSGGWACRERAKTVQSEAALLDLVHQLETQAERITGLQFKHQVAVRLRTRVQLPSRTRTK